MVTNKQEVQQTVNEKHQDVQVDPFKRLPGVETLNLMAGNVAGRDDLARAEGDVGPTDGVLGHWRVKCQILEIFYFDSLAHLYSPYNIEHTACSPGSFGGTDKISIFNILSVNYFSAIFTWEYLSQMSSKVFLSIPD